MKSIILAGGVGSRLWPLSREHFPKQFIKFDSFDKSLFQMTFERCLKLTENPDDIYVVTNHLHKFHVMGQIEELGYRDFNKENILAEPEGKNTLPAVYYGIKSIREREGRDCIVGVFPSDHLIRREDEERFIDTVKRGVTL